MLTHKPQGSIVLEQGRILDSNIRMSSADPVIGVCGIDSQLIVDAESNLT